VNKSLGLTEDYVELLYALHA